MKNKHTVIFSFQLKKKGFFFWIILINVLVLGAYIMKMQSKGDSTIGFPSYLLRFTGPSFAIVPNTYSCCLTLRKKCPYSQFFWSAFSHIRTKHGEILTPNTDTFHSVWLISFLFDSNFHNATHSAFLLSSSIVNGGLFK